MPCRACAPRWSRWIPRPRFEARALIPDPTAVPTALIRAAALADAGDAALFQPAPPPVRRWWPPPRWVQLTGLASTVVLVMGVATLLWLLLLG